MKKLVPVFLAIIGILVGGGTGFLLRPAPQVENSDVDKSTDEVDPETKNSQSDKKKEVQESQSAFVKLNNQFVVPVVSRNSVSALVVLSLTLETSPDYTEMLYSIEPKIRDAALRELFNHAYAGGFEGHFTAPIKLDQLRSRLLSVINDAASDTVLDVLIIDIIRQDT